MNVRFSIAFLLPLACLAGCNVAITPATQTTASSSTSITGNWQIQSGTAITSPPTAPYLVGALEGSDSALTGTFTTTQSSAASPQVLSISGTFNSSTGNLIFDGTPTLTADKISVELSVPNDPTTLSTGDYADECMVCALVPQSIPVIGVEVAPLNGTYSGTLSGTLTTESQTTQISGTVSLTLTQSTTPDSSGRFPITGVVTFPSSSGMSNATIPGLVRGITIELSTEGCMPPFATVVCTAIGPDSILNAYTNPTATQITVTNLFNLSESNGNSAASVNLTGTLTLQQ